MNAIDVQGLTKTYGDKTVVDDVSLTVREGEIAGFLGPNGSGKTTTIRLMCGLLHPDAGGGTVLGLDLRRQRLAIKQQVGYMTQRFSFYEDLTVEENLTFVARLYRQRPARAVVRDTMETFGLGARRAQLAGALSGGWKQRLALAACTLHRPRLLMLDEPTAGVDPKARRAFWDEIHHLSVAGITVLVSTHYMDEAERCHSIHYLHFGKLLTSGTTDEVVTRAGLSTMVVEGPDLARAEAALKGQTGVDQIAPFGATLHVVGRDGPLLRKTVAAAVGDMNVVTRPGRTSLEDVFIQFMGNGPGAA